MPVHRVSSAELESKLIELERSAGEHVDHIVPTAGGYVLVTSQLIELRAELIEEARDVCRFRP